MFKSKIKYIVSIAALAAFSIISVSIPKITHYYKTEFPRNRKLSQIQKCSSQYQYNKLLEDLVCSEDFKKYFDNEDFLVIYNKFRVNKNLTNLDYRVNSTFLLSFFKEYSNENINSRKTRELIENLESKKQELEKN